MKEAYDKGGHRGHLNGRRELLGRKTRFPVNPHKSSLHLGVVTLSGGSEKGNGRKGERKRTGRQVLKEGGSKDSEGPEHQCLRRKGRLFI